jgi:RNA polymerase sigma-70 factor (ECF subfamily)
MREIQVLEDREIIRRCQLGQTHLLDLLIDRHSVDLYSLCKKLTRGGPDADDLFQDTWVNVMKGLGSYTGEHAFKAWLFRICLNRYRDLYRRRLRWWRLVSRLPHRGHEEEEMAVAESPAPDPEQGAISHERAKAVREAIDQLEDTFRLPILLHYFQGLSMVEIGEALGIPAGTVKSRLSAGREKLKVAMEDAGHG